MQNIPAAPQGERYYAWFQNAAGQAVPLGPLTVQNGTTSLLYMGDSNHTNLLATIQGVLVTLEEVSNGKSSISKVALRSEDFYRSAVVPGAVRLLTNGKVRF